MKVPALSDRQLKSLAESIPDINRFVPLVRQPDYIVNGKLMDYQIEGVNFLY